MQHIVRSILVAGIAASVVGVTACDAPASARAGTTGTAPDSVAAADTARGDSAALASLPPRMAEDFAVRGMLTAATMRDTARVTCDELSVPNGPDERRRLHATLPDRSRAVLFARATRRDGMLRRVELVRRRPDGTQRGFIWSSAGDVIQTVEWAATGGPPEVTTLPRGGPTPRALRALARRFLTLPCGAPKR